MTRLVLAASTVALAIYSYFEIKTSLPLLTARIPTHAGTAPVSQALSTELYFCLFLQLLLSALLIGAPYVAADSIHFGRWRLSRYTPEQRERILPSLRELMALHAALVSCYFAARINLGINEARSHGPLLPADWLKQLMLTHLEWLVAVGVICGLIIYLYMAKFEEIAGEE